MFLPDREFVYYHKHKTDGRNINEVKFIISAYIEQFFDTHFHY